ncbi:MAG: TSUP family transporter [Oscillospiraceae bacterium]|nr:TSUP family transporter [Oscillospiraceae bacterium]
MTLTPQTFLIVCPMLFLAGLVDAIGGGGGLISLPAYLLAGVPMHNAIATNKLSSTCGTALTTVRFIREKLVNWKIAVPAVIFGMLGSSLGANLSMKMDEGIMEKVLFVVLPLVAFLVMNPKIFRDREASQVVPGVRLVGVSIASSFLVGLYDGFYGPGTGTFLIIAFTVFARMDMRSANAQAKVINLTTNITSLVIFLMNDQTIFLLGIAAAVCNMAGNYVGSVLALKQSSKVTRPVILLVLVLLFLKVLGIL